MLMNLYIPKFLADIFLEKLKDIPTIDDYILDKEQLGKQKVILDAPSLSCKDYQSLVERLPAESMIVDKLDFPGKEYFLCVGEVSVDHFSSLINEEISISIVTKKNDRIRFNGWVKYEDILYFFDIPYIEELSSINGLIENETLFSFSVEKDHLGTVYQLLMESASRVIIKNNKIYVKLLLEKFVSVFPKVKEKYKNLEIIDKNHFS